MLLKSLRFVESDMLCAFQTLLSVLNADPAFPILIPTSFRTLPSCRISHPKYVNFSTSLSSVLSIVTRWLSELRILIILVFLVSSDRGSGRRPSKNMEARERRVAILATTE